MTLTRPRRPIRLRLRSSVVSIALISVLIASTSSPRQLFAQAYLVVSSPQLPKGTEARYPTQPASFGRRLERRGTYAANVFLPPLTRGETEGSHDDDDESEESAYMCSQRYRRTKQSNGERMGGEGGLRGLMMNEDHGSIGSVAEEDGSGIVVMTNRRPSTSGFRKLFGKAYWTKEDSSSSSDDEEDVEGEYPAAETGSYNVEEVATFEGNNSSSNDHEVIPIALLVKRGRCSFREKANEVKRLNEELRKEAEELVLTSSSSPEEAEQKNGDAAMPPMPQISYLLVYDHYPANGGYLIVMGGGSSFPRGGHGNDNGWGAQDDLAALFLSYDSGEDLYIRIMDWEKTSGASPYLSKWDFLPPIYRNTYSTREPSHGADNSTTSHPSSVASKNSSSLAYPPRQQWSFPVSVDGDNPYASRYSTCNTYGRYGCDDAYESVSAMDDVWIAYLFVAVVTMIVFMRVMWVRHWRNSRRRIVSENGPHGDINVDMDGQGRPRLAQRSKSGRATMTKEEVLALPEIEFVMGSNFVATGDKAGEVEGKMEDEDQATAELSSPDSSAADATNANVTTCTLCSICIDDFAPGEKLRQLPQCRHMFHTECILPWLTERSARCPLCKRSVVTGEEEKIG
uniref:RING-type domain-containing protein n=1 Tax=Pseudictyota dubia TaxID=2749911 RepID=A0A7R9Z8X1_9STRA